MVTYICSGMIVGLAIYMVAFLAALVAEALSLLVG